MTPDQIEAVKIFSAYALLTVVVLTCAWITWVNLFDTGDFDD